MRSIRSSAPRCLAVILVLLLSLGHACESAVADVVAHVHGAAHHSSEHDRQASSGHDHHAPGDDADEARVSCDAVVALASSNSTVVEPGTTVDADGTRPAVDALPWRVAAGAARQASDGAGPRLPLFLLHASLLI